MNLSSGKSANEGIMRLVEQRDQNILTFPDSLRNPRCEVRSDIVHTLGHEVRIQDTRSTFWRRPLDISLQPTVEGSEPCIILNGIKITPKPEWLQRGRLNYLSFANDKARLDVVEHLFALLEVFHLQVDVIINTPGKKLQRISLPTLEECNGKFIDAIGEAGLHETGLELPSFTVEEPICMIFEHGGYILIEPPREGEEDHLIMDHQISYPHSIGSQRIEYTLTPGSFASLARARAPAHGWRARAVQVLNGNVPLIDANPHNVILVPKGGTANPKSYFDHDGHNFEPLAHEIVDRVFPIMQLGVHYHARFVGRWTTNLVGHRHEIQAIRALMNGSGGVRFVFIKGRAQDLAFYC